MGPPLIARVVGIVLIHSGFGFGVVWFGFNYANKIN